MSEYVGTMFFLQIFTYLQKQTRSHLPKLLLKWIVTIGNNSLKL